MTDSYTYYKQYLYPIPSPISRIDILGGGPSRQHYTDSGSFVISCHVPLVRTDLLVSKHPEYYPPFSIPCITKKTWNADSDDLNTPFNKEEEYSVENLTVWVKLNHDSKKKNYLENIKKIKNKTRDQSLNTGQTGYMWALAQNPDEIHLWGIDAYEYWEAHYNYYEDHIDLAHTAPWGKGAFSDSDDGLQRSTQRWKEIIKPNTVIHLNNNTIYI